MERIAAIGQLRFGPQWMARLCASAGVPKSLLSMVMNKGLPLTDAAYCKLLEAIDREIVAMDKASVQAKRIRALMS
ncbi:MAG: hypothetical protein Q7T73_14905 [Beijerinckiaceae bacterium]|nr:hypothetical protein [Beijerinckiaceae bacterium]